MKSFIILSSAIVIGSALTFSGSVFAKSVCELAADESARTLVNVVDPIKDDLNSAEKAMIQSVVLFTNLEAPISFEGALKVFSDIREDGKPGGHGGQISYYNVGTRLIAIVTYFPGDNQYGQMFTISKYDTRMSPYLIGTIGDSDLNCLNPVDSTGL